MSRWPLVLAGLVAWGCSERERSNPLDPGNPNTHGAPTGFVAVTNRDTAHLSWDPVDLNSLESYRLQRSVAGAPYEVLARIAPNLTHFTDAPLNYDIQYVYTVQAITQFGESLPSPADTTVPGPHNFWVADFNGGGVSRLSYDGGHVLDQKQFNSPEAVAYQPGSSLVWVADYYDRSVLGLDIALTEVARVVLEGLPIELVLAATGNAVYILQRSPGLLIIADERGEILETIKTPGQVGIDGSLAFDPVTQSLWLGPAASTTDGSVYRLALDGTREWVLAATVPTMRRLAADPVYGGCWVATDSGVVRIEAGGTERRFVPDVHVWDVSVNAANGDCYFAGRVAAEDRWQVGRIHGIAQDQVAIILDGTYDTLLRIKVLPGPGQMGFLATQWSTGRLLRFDRDGMLMSRMDGFGFPLEFAVE